MFPQCLGRTLVRGGDGDIDADDWQERIGAKCVKFDQRGCSIASQQTPSPYKAGAGVIVCWSWGEDSEAVPDHSLWLNAQLDVGSVVKGPGRMFARPEGPDRMLANSEVEDHLRSYFTCVVSRLLWCRRQSVRACPEGLPPTLLASQDTCELGCFRRWSKHTSDNAIVTRCATIWEMIEGNVGVKGWVLHRNHELEWIEIG